ncbi:MAG: hypothetical protein ACRBBN_03390 [Methyloligellaceae bacterium]
MRFIFKILTVNFIMILGTLSAHSEECMKIASNPNSSKAIAVLTPGIQMAFQKAKICVDYVTLPSARIQKSMKDSSIDGEFLAALMVNSSG